MQSIMSWLRTRLQRQRLRCGENVQIDPTVQFTHIDRIMLGSHIYIGPNCLLHGEGGLSIGDGCIFAPRVVIWTSNHRYKQESLLPYDIYDEYGSVCIGKGVWIGLGAMIAPGVSIGDGAVVGMGAIVTGVVTPGAVMVGNPAQKVSCRDPKIVERLIKEEAYYLSKYQGKVRTRVPLL